jgi:hypothetical protein
MTAPDRCRVISFDRPFGLYCAYRLAASVVEEEPETDLLKK